MKIEKKTKVTQIKTYETYGKIFDNRIEAESWKSEVETKLRASLFIVELEPDEQGRFTRSILFEVRDYLGQSGLLSFLQKKKIKFIDFVEDKAIKSINIVKINKFNSWTEMQAFLDNIEVESIQLITERKLK